jgi:uncharacterized protein
MHKLDSDQAKLYVLQRLEKELSPGLYYHSLRHTTQDVVPATAAFAEAENIQGESLDLLLTAAWFHDLGFVEVRAGHEAVGARIASEVLPDFGYTDANIHVIQHHPGNGRRRVPSPFSNKYWQMPIWTYWDVMISCSQRHPP